MPATARAHNSTHLNIRALSAKSTLMTKRVAELLQGVAARQVQHRTWLRYANQEIFKSGKVGMRTILASHDRLFTLPSQAMILLIVSLFYVSTA